MLFAIIITTLLATMKIVHIDGIKATSPVSIILDGFTLQTWMQQSLWNRTQTSIVRHLNELCKKDYHCDAEYGIGNIHLINTDRYGSLSVRLNLTVDEPVQPFNMKFGNATSLYNYTALLIGALAQTKTDIEHLYDNQSLYSHQDSVVSGASRLLFVLLGVVLVAIVFGLTVFFFQRIRRHSYSKLLKTARTGQTTQDEPLTDSPSMSALHQ